MSVRVGGAKDVRLRIFCGEGGVCGGDLVGWGGVIIGV